MSRRLLTAVALMAVTAVAFVGSLVLFIVMETDRDNLKASGAHAAGHVVAVHPSDWWNPFHLDYKGNLDVEYKTPSGTVTARIYTNAEPTPVLGDAYEVIYDPANPTDARGVSDDDMNETPQWMGTPLFLGLFGGLPALIGCVAWVVATMRLDSLREYGERGIPLRIGPWRSGVLEVRSDAIVVHAHRWFGDGLQIEKANVMVVVPGDPSFDLVGDDDWVFDPPLAIPYLSRDSQRGPNLTVLFKDQVVIGTSDLADAEDRHHEPLDDDRIDGLDLRVTRPREAIECLRRHGFEIQTRPMSWLYEHRPVTRDPDVVSAGTAMDRRRRWFKWSAWIPFVVVVGTQILGLCPVWVAGLIGVGLSGAVALLLTILDGQNLATIERVSREKESV